MIQVAKVPTINRQASAPSNGASLTLSGTTIPGRMKMFFVQWSTRSIARCARILAAKLILVDPGWSAVDGTRLYPLRVIKQVRLERQTGHRAVDMGIARFRLSARRSRMGYRARRSSPVRCYPAVDPKSHPRPRPDEQFHQPPLAGLRCTRPFRVPLPYLRVLPSARWVMA